MESNAPEIETLAAGKNSHRHLVRLGCGKDELHMGWGFFKGLEQRVESAGGKHVNFVNDEYLVAKPGWEVPDIVAQLTDIVDAGIRGAVDLDDVC